MYMNPSFEDLAYELIEWGKFVDTGEWQSLRGESMPQHKTIEVLNQRFIYTIPEGVEQLQEEIEPNLPWAENHFQERVCGLPLNPGEQYKNWPWYRGNVETHKQPGQFSHTYMERFWPKMANIEGTAHPLDKYHGGRAGIRFNYGDLNDVVELLASSPHTRQAFLPVWFPEDTGAVHGERVPCTLGYHFIMRQNKLHIVYFIRSCDFLRHFRDDVYMAARLCQWMIDQLIPRSGPNDTRWRESDSPWAKVEPGVLTMHMTSLHIFEGDLPSMRRKYASGG